MHDVHVYFKILYHPVVLQASEYLRVLHMRNMVVKYCMRVQPEWKKQVYTPTDLCCALANRLLHTEQYCHLVTASKLVFDLICGQKSKLYIYIYSMFIIYYVKSVSSLL